MYSINSPRRLYGLKLSDAVAVTCKYGKSNETYVFNN